MVIKNSYARPSSVSTAQRAGAGFLALLLLVLNLIAFAPAAHAWLHQSACSTQSSVCPEHGAPPNPAPSIPVHHDDTCAVMLFSQGIEVAPSVLANLAPAQLPFTTPSPAKADILVSNPQHRLPASQAPPIG
jgi:hypothetical protein